MTFCDFILLYVLLQCMSILVVEIIIIIIIIIIIKISTISYEKCCAGINKSLAKGNRTLRLRLNYLARSGTALNLIRFICIKIIFSSCLSKTRSKAAQFSHKRLHSVFNIARTAYTNRYVLIDLIIWKHLFESIALLKPRFK